MSAAIFGTRSRQSHADDLHFCLANYSLNAALAVSGVARANGSR